MVAMTLDDATIDLIHAAMDLPGDPARHRVVCAMSGGVDSSVAAALLKCAGYDVLGITLQLYDHGEAVRRKGACCAGQDIHDARRVAARLAIPHYILDFESRFQEAVVDDFVQSYLAGHTPIPCVQCNRTVKFADLLSRAQDLGASALATGHYVTSTRRGDGHRAMLTPADMNRDQSYFLFATTQQQLNFLRFPLGGLTKPETRRLAGELGLTVADKPDSQDICFVPEGRYAEVVARHAPHAVQPGAIVDREGKRIGDHRGIVNFTVGQRKGLGIAGVEPLYVLALDAARREVVAGPREALLQREFLLRDVNWLGDRPLDQSEHPVLVKIRSAHPASAATLRRSGGAATVSLMEGAYGIAPGQACVFYDRSGSGARVLGGGFIAPSRPQGATQALSEPIFAVK